MAVKILTGIAIALFIITLIIYQCKKLYLTCDLSVFILRDKYSLNLYHCNKKIDYINLSVGRIHKWYALCNDNVYIVHRFKNRIDKYTYFDIPENDYCYLSKKVDMNCYRDYYKN